jgi:hypothetical protein
MDLLARSFETVMPNRRALAPTFEPRSYAVRCSASPNELLLRNPDEPVEMPDLRQSTGETIRKRSRTNPGRDDCQFDTRQGVKERETGGQSDHAVAEHGDAADP